ncbi:MAG: DUF4126 domain-containing protein [Pseudomonadota bacterium]|nr:DUF4126 domain-containing protein [Pseudomonadota bacterium]
MQEQGLIASFVQWLHGLGIHIGPDAAQAVGQGADAASAAASGALARMDMPSLIALAAALGWASGFRLYAVVFLVGAMGAAGWVALPAGLAPLMHPAVLGVSGALMLVEFFADKIPWVDSAWDSLNSVIRIPGGALLAAGVFGADSGTTALLAGLLGGSLAATAFATKATTRAAVNTSPEPFSNWGLSFFEDGLTVFVLWLAVQHPVVFGIALALMLAVSVLLLIVLYKFLKKVIAGLKRFVGSSPPTPTTSTTPDTHRIR